MKKIQAFSLQVRHTDESKNKCSLNRNCVVFIMYDMYEAYNAL